MKYFLDSEFIENGDSIDLLSIAIVSEDSRSLYRQFKDAKFLLASDWVWRNVFPSLQHFRFSSSPGRDCNPMTTNSMGDKASACHAADCPWRSRWEVRDEILKFCDSEKFGKPEFWGYYADYDWVGFCQLFGSMSSLPKGWPMYCRDLKQWCDFLGNPKLPEQGKGEHHALTDAIWNKKAWEFLNSIGQPTAALEHAKGEK